MDFTAALERMSLNLTAAELKLVVDRAVEQASSGDGIDYERFVGAVFRPSHSMIPHFITHPRARDAGDILGWTTPPVRKEVRSLGSFGSRGDPD